jgi:predicted nucleic acid-binding protein
MRHIILDSSPLSLVTDNPSKIGDVKDCHQWLQDILIAGHEVYIPEVCDYEVRRELIRSQRLNSIKRMNTLKGVLNYIPIDTNIMLEAAKHWASIRNQGLTTAHNTALDADVILCSQALSLGLLPTDMVIATSNIRHISRFVPCDLWKNIVPGT